MPLPGCQHSGPDLLSGSVDEASWMSTVVMLHYSRSISRQTKAATVAATVATTVA